MSAQQPRVRRSDLTGHVYLVTRYTDLPGGGMLAKVKIDITDEFDDLMGLVWDRGWNECNAAPRGSAPSNPYRKGPNMSIPSDDE